MIDTGKPEDPCIIWISTTWQLRLNDLCGSLLLTLLATAPASQTDPETSHRDFVVSSKMQRCRSTWQLTLSAASMLHMLTDAAEIGQGSWGSQEYFRQLKSYTYKKWTKCTSITRYHPGGGETICRKPMAVRRWQNRSGSTSVRGRVRSPRISGGWRWLSCRQPACL